MVKVFVNHVDSYTGKALSKVLGGAVVGATVADDGEQEAAGEAEVAQSGAAGGQHLYQVVGTLKDPQSAKPTWVTDIIPQGSGNELVSLLMTCDIIIYHITETTQQVDEASSVLQALHDQLSAFTTQKVFILVSTILTWARSKPLDPEEPDVPFQEEDYRRRRPHPNFKSHIAAEKLVIKLGKTDKSKLLSYVVASGLTYGAGESIFHFLFKAAWHGEIPSLPVFGDGKNVLPIIHINDLASIVLSLADGRPKVRYVLAVDESHSTLKEIVKVISSHLGTGKIQYISKEDALLNKDISQSDYDHLLVNLQMEASCAKDGMTFTWKAESGLVESISAVTKEFKESRGLLPIRACVLGPPAVGKTHMVAQLCKYYKLHHIKIADVIKEAIEKMERTAARADIEPADPAADEEEDEIEDDDGKAQNAQEFLDLLKEDRETNNGRYSDQYIIDFFRGKLASMPCQNQGFILDGFPKTYDQAKQLFAPDEQGEDELLATTNDGEEPPLYNRLTMPEVVISLDAGDDFLKQRVMNLPQSQVEGTHNTEDGLKRRLELFRTENEVDTTVLNYFDEFEIHPDHIDIEKDSSDSMEQSFEQIKKIIGEPRNYGPTPEEKAEMDRRALEEKLRRDAEEREMRENAEAEEKALRSQRQAEWESQLALVKKEEQEMLETQSIPLRNYLLQHVMPTLTEGLIEVCKVKPEDAVDYLAEYLFKHNPQID